MDERIAGSIAGAVATVPMTAAMATLQRILPGEPHPSGAGAQVRSMDDSAHEGLSLAAHFGFGATAGAGYSPFAGKSGLPPVAEGALYGLAVWGGGYLGVMPASGLYKPVTEDTAERNLLLISAHLVWGAALGLVWHSLMRRGTR